MSALLSEMQGSADARNVKLEAHLQELKRDLEMAHLSQDVEKKRTVMIQAELEDSKASVLVLQQDLEDAKLNQQGASLREAELRMELAAAQTAREEQALKLQALTAAGDELRAEFEASKYKHKEVVERKEQENNTQVFALQQTIVELDAKMTAVVQRQTSDSEVLAEQEASRLISLEAERVCELEQKLAESEKVSNPKHAA